jgi:hypothetical protein
LLKKGYTPRERRRVEPGGKRKNRGRFSTHDTTNLFLVCFLWCLCVAVVCGLCSSRLSLSFLSFFFALAQVVRPFPCFFQHFPLPTCVTCVKFVLSARDIVVCVYSCGLAVSAVCGCPSLCDSSILALSLYPLPSVACHCPPSQAILLSISLHVIATCPPSFSSIFSSFSGTHVVFHLVSLTCFPWQVTRS